MDKIQQEKSETGEILINQNNYSYLAGIQTVDNRQMLGWEHLYISIYGAFLQREKARKHKAIPAATGYLQYFD